jgi:predicted metal-dependent phosphoesterase TrpH
VSRIDLHTHSSASDGTLPPEAVVRAAAEAGLDVVALTDHDTTDGWVPAAEALPPGLRLVRGAELSCTAQGISLHLLAYLFDPEDASLSAALAEVRDSRVSRARRMVEKLRQDGHEVTWDQVQVHAQGTVGRPHIARALVSSGLVDSVGEAFTADWIGPRGRYWAAKHELDAVEAVRLVAAAGGVTVFAHPAAASRGRTVPDEVIASLAEAGLAGLEVDHVDHTEQARDHLRGLADDLDLLVTGSSDFHGDNKAVRLGAHLTAPSAYDELVARATGVEVL